ncbi:hypothetical protein AB4212_62820 [Streptomyces sp. 2MCAF27]
MARYFMVTSRGYESAAPDSGPNGDHEIGPGRRDPVGSRPGRTPTVHTPDRRTRKPKAS